MGYEVNTGVYEGPFDLLLRLILKQEVDLWEVSLVGIVDAYLAELNRMETTDLEVSTEFLLIAATLVELKTRRLLPSESDPDLDEELLRFETRDLLLARLLECKTFQDASRTISLMLARASQSVARQFGPEEPYRSLVPDPLEQVRPSRLRDAAIKALTPKQSEFVNTEHIAPIRVSVAEASELLLERIPERGVISFRELASDAPTRIDAIVRFLAVLELFKQGFIEIDQIGTFGLISVSRTDREANLDSMSMADWESN